MTAPSLRHDRAITAPSLRHHCAITAQDAYALKTLNTLLKHGADPTISTIENGETALMIAIQWGSISLVKALLDHDEGLMTACDVKEFSALHHAAFNGQVQILKLLLERGADVTARKTS